MDKEKPLYHYCSLETFLSIISSKSIWLSDVSKSNDSEELIWTKKEYYKIIDRIYKDPTETNEKHLLCDMILDIAGEEGICFEDDTRIPNVNKSKLMSASINNTRAYAFCLSAKDDSLGQWRGYADDGKGVAIGFNKMYLKNVFKIASEFSLYQVLYSTEQLESVTKNIALKNIPSDVMGNEFIKFIIKQIRFMCNIAATFKNPCFQEEEEWRVIHVMNDEKLIFDNSNSNKINVPLSEEQLANIESPSFGFICRNNTIIPHISIEFKEMNNAIETILIGPKSHVRENDIKQLLIANGLLRDINDNSITIIKSKSSYR